MFSLRQKIASGKERTSADAVLAAGRLFQKAGVVRIFRRSRLILSTLFLVPVTEPKNSS
ncbi:MAG: hypothetical protein H6Q92_1281 [Nitrospirae bacterium]|nr:hypothetical protein [Nitrospirota bacterium]